MRTFIILLIIILLTEYYSFTAVNSLTRHLSNSVHWGTLIVFGVVSLGALCCLFLFPYWSTVGWPSDFFRFGVMALVGIFLGQVLLAAFMLAGDLVMVPFKIIRFFTSTEKVDGGLNLMTRGKFISQTALVLGAALTGGLIYGISNRYRYKIRRLKLTLDRLPESFKGLKIVQLSDIHSGSFDDKDAVAEGIRMVMDEKPDLILFTGDLVNNKAEELVPYLEVFKLLKAPLGVYSVLGNHDYGEYVSWASREEKEKNLDQLKQYQAEMGWKLLNNEHVILERGTGRLALIGVENWSAKAHFPRYGNLSGAMQGISEDGVPVKILMSHDPSHWDAEVLPSYPGITLTLSGHTHGMQFGIEIPGFKWSPAQYFYKRWAGLYREGDQYLYVNRGFGFLGYQGRLGILPEITVFELT